MGLGICFGKGIAVEEGGKVKEEIAKRVTSKTRGVEGT